MAKDKRLKTPAAAAAAEKDAPPPDAAPPLPSPQASNAASGYLLSLHELRRIFGGDTAGDSAQVPPPSTAEAVERLQQALGVQHAGANPRSAAWVDFCFGVLCFARSSESYGANVPRFCGGGSSEERGDEKALLALTIADEMFQFATTPAADGPDRQRRLPTLEQCYDRFRERVREASNVPPPAELSSSDGVAEQPQQPRAPPTLSASEVASFVAFMSTTFFRHLAAYQLLGSRTRASVTRRVELCVESPLPPAPLASATLLAGAGDDA
ncbi:hypothetical protein PybrP1_006508 [[Pythium] brassicae (nom. inval.)]|nr:hypothetical protein PybrP1_006508 [[Pythium] brassicae (nom. inval.)]